jgi:hypothetical protein
LLITSHTYPYVVEVLDLLPSIMARHIASAKRTSSLSSVRRFVAECREMARVGVQKLPQSGVCVEGTDWSAQKK